MPAVPCASRTSHAFAEITNLVKTTAVYRFASFPAVTAVDNLGVSRTATLARQQEPANRDDVGLADKAPGGVPGESAGDGRQRDSSAYRQRGPAEPGEEATAANLGNDQDLRGSRR